MKTAILFLFFSMPLFFAACSPSEQQEQRAARVSSREANIEHYLQKAKENNSLALLRAKPLLVQTLTHPTQLSQIKPVKSPVSLPEELEKSKTLLEARVRAAYGEEAALKAGALILQYHQEALNAVKEAASAQEMAQRLRELDAKQRERLNQFLKTEQSNVWLRPTQAQVEKARGEMQKKNEEMLARLSTVYGPVCMEKIKPVLYETVQSYLLAMASAQDKKELDERVAAISAKGEEQMQLLIAQYGDPAGPAPEEEITSMRAQMIAAYQVLEQKIETLYGKEAVLQVRPIFNQILENASNVARTSTRVSYKQEELTRLNAVYREKIAKLQIHFNQKEQSKRKKPSPKSLMQIH